MSHLTSRIGAGSEVVFDKEVAFDPLEEEVDLPTALEELFNGESGDLQVVAEEEKMIGRLLVEEAHPAQRIREVGRCFGKRWRSKMIAENALQTIRRVRPMSDKAKIDLGANDEEGSGKNDPSKTGKIRVGAINHIEGTCFEDQVVDPVNIGFAGSGDADTGRDRATKIQLGMHLYAGFGVGNRPMGRDSGRDRS